jgi:hypothetical protein
MVDSVGIGSDQVIATTKAWETDEYSIEVDFGPDGKALRILGFHAVKDSLIERIPLVHTLRSFIPIL